MASVRRLNFEGDKKIKQLNKINKIEKFNELIMHVKLLGNILFFLYSIDIGQ